MKAGAEWEELDFVFTTDTGRALDPDNATRRFKKLLTKAGLTIAIRFHDLRRSHATFLAASGVPPVVAMKILGHSRIRTTLDVYTHATEEGFTKAAIATAITSRERYRERAEKAKGCGNASNATRGDRCELGMHVV